MANKSNLSGCFNILNKHGLKWYVDQYAIPASLHPVLPEKDTPIYPFVPGKIGVYTRLFDYCNYRLPLTKFLIDVLLFHEVHLSQMNPFGLAKLCHLELSCRGLGSNPDLDVFRAFYKLNRSGSWYTFEVRKKNACCYSWITTSLKDWKDRFFLVDDRCVLAVMSWRLKTGRVQKYPEHILVLGRISTIWAEPEWYPTLRWNGEVMGLKDALRLKSFDSTELDVRATKTPKGDPPYLSVVQENLFPIREPTAPINQGGSAGQGGLGSAPSIRTVNVAPAQTAAVVGGDRGKEKVSHEAKGSDSKVVLYGSVHLSVEDEEVNVEGGDKGDDDVETRPQISLKRGRTTSSKADPNPKTQKKKKLDFHTLTLDDDEADQATGFSTAGGLLDNLNANIHGGRTPRDRPVNIPMSPLSFGGPSTKVIEDIHMPDPLSCKKIEPSPSGSGDAADMDSARALEKYVPEWSLVNKDRIVDALSTKMVLFHLGTLAEHAYYRKMGGPELGNALMLNQAQSNSLVVETYKRWVESESNCRRFEHEIANLKSEDNVRSKTKQELSSLRSQVDRLKEQVSEAKEVNKSSQASAAAAYEARDKALQDLEALKLKFGDIEKKLSDAEKRNKAVLKEMQTSYDQLLANHHRLISDKDEIERAHDRAIESHRTTIDEAKGMLTRCDGEMVDLYAQVLELMLTKQWFLADGIAWVVILVHQSPELEKVVADLVNNVNVVGVNE
ncbi:hypothetical protein HanXRQr2_Chr11g0507761 [Helianthus annuus]|uniref:Transposase (putative) gypsy type domain-containing protein n=1 Tax=Helianthus annuus TaxID=4232 RepID=A0A9K3HRZ0_HELAN|nr:hypothetical protein HanXRQr2_Chr11g0507761 [Helianthus annuus]KAJ0502743.1 hypothetical protein HanHA300_Chr11g0416401 [Helianthus annuus]KAJ0518704.1 hypothetical protein HanHA89_Chr11g0440441 [Helianthus annuus]